MTRLCVEPLEDRCLCDAALAAAFAAGAGATFQADFTAAVNGFIAQAQQGLQVAGAQAGQLAPGLVPAVYGQLGPALDAVIAGEPQALGIIPEMLVLTEEALLMIPSTGPGAAIAEQALMQFEATLASTVV